MHRINPSIIDRKAEEGFSALFVDLDGTVLNTKQQILASFHYACDQVLGYRIEDQKLVDLIGIPLLEQMRILVAEEHVDAMVAAYREYQTEPDIYTEHYEGVHEALTALAGVGWPMAVVTSSRYDRAYQGLASFNLDRFFETIVAYENSERHKPHPDPLLKAAELLEVDVTRAIYVGDSPFDMQAAKAIGMLAVGASWGFFGAERLQEAGADLLVDRFSELPEGLAFARYQP
ncbi:MAG: HAD-IA family hydrolase [Coriobacteriia bacterium]|nr:HAD-IA family hydrolase [Coriobacteriia bacterium]